METPEASFLGPSSCVFIFGIIAYFSVVSFESKTIESKDAKPYTVFGHPKKFFVDKIAGIIIKIVLPFHKLQHPLSHKKEDHQSKNQKSGENEHIFTMRSIRVAFYRFEYNLTHLPYLFLWNRLVAKKDKQDFLVGGTVMIPRESNISVEWGIQKASNGQKGLPDFAEHMPVEIDITCPASVIHGDVTYETAGGYGLKKLFKTCKLEDLKLSQSVPIIFYIHGGGFVVGSTRDSSTCHPYSLLSQRSKEMKAKDACPPLILASVKYRLAPENPFPAAVIDCLSAAKCMFEGFPSSDVHISGFSAGGGLATVVGFESVRKYPGRVKSIAPLNPVTLPRSYTVSAHMNSVSSYVPPLTPPWFWAAYLQLGDYHDKDSYHAELGKHELYQLGNVGCINPMLRLVYPQVDIPKELKDHDSAPKVFVVTSSADPLCDDGNDLAACLKDEGANVEKYECIGNHGTAMVFDSKNFNKFAKAWGEEVWPQKN